MVALPLGLGSAAAGQSGEPLDQMGGAYRTGTWSVIDGSYLEEAESTGPTYTDVLGYGTQGTVAADDPRVAGTMTAIANARHTQGAEAVALHAGRARIDNDAGAWVGTYTAWGTPLASEEWHVLEGEGAYEA